MPNFTCAVADCTSDSRKGKRKTNQVTEDVKRFVRFPSGKKEPKRRKMWEERCRRAGGWKATQNHAVCSLHFLDWNNGPSPEHSDPILFAYNGWGRNHHAVINRKANSLQCQGQDVIAAPNASTSTQCNTETQFPQEEVLPLNVQDWGEVEVCTATEDSDTTLPDESCNVLGDHTYGAYTHSETVAEPVDVEVQTDQFTTLEKASQTYEEVHEWERNNVVEDGALRNAFIQKILRSSESIKRYTGMEEKDFFYLFNLIKDNVTDIHYWRGPNSVKNENTPPGITKGHTKRKLSRLHEYLMTLVHIRTGFDLSTLADLWEVAQSVASSIIITWINILYLVLKDWLIWPTAAQVRASLPKDFPEEYSDTRTILDCTEIFTVKPANPSAQAATYSQYKHHNTLKVLTGITPTGLITFVSSVYGGNTSDRYTAEAEFIDKVEPGDAIMVDRGFNIGDLILQRGAKLHIPPFTRKEASKGRMLTQSEIAKTRSIATLRIHVERAIGRMKTFKLLGQTLHQRMWPLMDHIVVIVAVLCNMMPPLV
ncbi:uncharacterized protein LOC135099123 [Scylla paramamosain]|uniref:uncharacterized protein LOC135099123 n=1 Tax=Scylla paramamosain TaxID=85552 RepID=UPI0030832BF3